MRISPSLIRHIHFVGIGGIGMSGIAEVLSNLGYFITGSDQGEGGNVKRLRSLGMTVHQGHDAQHIRNAQVLVVSTAVPSDNPEIVAAKKLHIPIVTRAEMLAELMRLKLAVAIAGTHGKTTTTSLMAHLFESANLHPTVVNGGILNAYHTNAKLGTGDWIVVEADESDGSFVKLFPTLAIVTNMDEDHMDFYPNFEAIRQSFLTFLHRVPFYGAAILCNDHHHVRELMPQLTNKRVILYGFQQGAHVRGVNLRPTDKGTFFDVDIAPPAQARPQLTDVVHLPRRIRNVFLPMMGEHNVQNVLSLFAVAGEVGIADDVVVEALSRFKGVKRRFTKVAEVSGVTIIDDYAHHPVEIEKTLQAARQATQGKILAVFQPHRFTRLHALYQDFLHCFHGADHVFVLPVYGAGEDAIPERNADQFAKDLNAIFAHSGNKTNVIYIENPDNLPVNLVPHMQSGDMILCMGAGSITRMAAELPAQFSEILPLIFEENSMRLQACKPQDERLILPLIYTALPL